VVSSPDNVISRDPEDIGEDPLQRISCNSEGAAEQPYVQYRLTSNAKQQEICGDPDDTFISYKALGELHEKNTVVFVKGVRYLDPPKAYRDFVHHLKPYYGDVPELGHTSIGEAVGAECVGFKSLLCVDEDAEVIVPEYGRVGHYNPIKGDRVVKSSVSRLAAVLPYLNAENNTKGVDLVGIDATYPDEVSRLLCDKDQRSSVLERARKCEKALINALGTLLGVENDELIGGWSNTHLWSTTEPTKPHLHHHLNVLNLVVKKSVLNSADDLSKHTKPDINGKERVIAPIDAIEPEDGRYATNYRVNADGEREKVYTLKNAIRRVSPYIKGDAIKELWAAIVCSEFAGVVTEKYEKLDVHLGFISIKNKAAVVHRLKYCSRKPLMDLFEYYSKNDFDAAAIDDGFCLMLLGYANRRNTFGFARKLNRLVLIRQDKNVCSICGSPARLQDRLSSAEVLDLLVNRKAVLVQWEHTEKEYVLIRRRDRLKELFKTLGVT